MCSLVDFPLHTRSLTLPNLPGSSSLDVPPSPSYNITSRGSPCTSPRGSPRVSPRGSPRGKRRNTGVVTQPSVGSGSEKDKSPTHLNWTKSQWRRKGIRKRQSSTGRSSSVSSDRSLSPTEKMVSVPDIVVYPHSKRDTYTVTIS